MNNLLHIFIESTWSANAVSLVLNGFNFLLSFFNEGKSPLPLPAEATLIAMKYFGYRPMTVPVAVAIAGAMTGQVFNWIIGLWLWKHRNKLHIGPDRYERIATLFRKYGIFLLFFSWAPILNLLPILAAFTRAPTLPTLTLVLLGEVYAYGTLLW